MAQSTDPTTLLNAATDRTLALAETWLRWDGRPFVTDDNERIYTPHKAIRRYADHLLDHLAQTQALLSGAETIPDEWRASLVTLESDWAHFTEADLREAQQRIRRLTQTYVLVLQACSADELDRERGQDVWTLREIVEHVASPWYAEQVGDRS
ncbi:hypothetical protein [Luteipulveratus mongoliensis]|uniref:DinB-like domain-containing protein n=1 Tax=Luteipulveratus mongoliensis TaxID=571913 RepID=A0A0K1JN84_9MICO|nr:hypothetical protein [Luteipulveratus mongoliensis]AKU18182.1 hypothetical protein VV02_23905 [Luteipulveratus mongoliensis]